jgi:hypothetical protein
MDFPNDFVFFVPFVALFGVGYSAFRNLFSST